MRSVGEEASNENKSKSVTDPGGETAGEKKKWEGGGEDYMVLKEGQSKWKWADQRFGKAENVE